MLIHLGEEIKFMYNSLLFLSASSPGKICEQSQSLVIKGSILPLAEPCWQLHSSGTFLDKNTRKVGKRREPGQKRTWDIFGLVLGKLSAQLSPGKCPNCNSAVSCSVFAMPWDGIHLELFTWDFFSSHLIHPQLQITVLSSHRVFTPLPEPEWSVHDRTQLM